MQRSALAVPKYQLVFDAVRAEIESGRLAPGARVPSESELGERFGASRITVGRAMRDLQTRGLIQRRVGSGSYVTAPPRIVRAECTFGVLVPDLPDIEIFDPLVQRLLSCQEARPHAFLWGGGDSAASARPAEAWARVQQYVTRKVDGVFFAPLEGLAVGDDTNLRIVAALDGARIPVVLLDRAVHPYPRRGPYDLVGIDNRRVGFAVTEHLVRQGARRIAFLGGAPGVSTIAARRAGYREALDVLGADASLVAHPFPSPTNRDEVRTFVETYRPDALVCAHDRAAAQAMHALLAVGARVPDDIRMVGVDDVDYAAWLPVALTTMRQPVQEIGEAAMAAMLERRAHPARPPRDIFVQCELIVRQSCGAGRRPQP